MKIGSREIGAGQPCFIIGEVACAHDGSLGLAHAFIDAVADAGADAVKYQFHVAAKEVAPCEPWRVEPEHPQDASRFDYWKRMEFSEDQWRGLKQHAEQRGLIFLCTPFSVHAAEVLLRMGVSAWKIASGEIGNMPLLQALAASELPVIISTGMATLGEIAIAADQFRRFSLLQCTSIYPTPARSVGLSMLGYFRATYGCPVGLSDHSGTIYPGLAAVTMGANIVEVHVKTTPAFGPDASSSVDIADLRRLVDGARFVEQMLWHPVNKDSISEHLEPVRSLFMGKWKRKRAHDEELRISEAVLEQGNAQC